MLVKTLYSRINEFNIENFPEGIYFVMLENSRGTAHKKLIVK
jgi:hypothetical protein